MARRIPLMLSVLIFVITITMGKLFRFTIGETLVRLVFMVPIFYAAGHILVQYVEETKLEEGTGDSHDNSSMEEPRADDMPKDHGEANGIGLIEVDQSHISSKSEEL